MTSVATLLGGALHDGASVHVVVTFEGVHDGERHYDWSRSDVPAADGNGRQRHRIRAASLAEALQVAVDAVGESLWSGIAVTFAHAVVRPRETP